jgi:hypothetical protein
MQTAASPAPAAAVENTLTSAEREQANQHLAQTRDAVLGAITGLSETQWVFQPSPDSWSIARIVEHVALIQERVLNMVRNHLPAGPMAPPDRNVQLIDAIVINQFPNRLTKFSGPEAVQPTRDCPLGEARNRLVTNTQRFIECLETAPGLRDHVLEAPPLKAITKGEYTVLDGYQWILAASAHSERHAKQILEVKVAPGFPVG